MGDWKPAEHACLAKSIASIFRLKPLVCDIEAQYEVTVLGLALLLPEKFQTRSYRTPDSIHGLWAGHETGRSRRC